MIILLGKPGAGKGTQAELLEREEGFVSVSTGELLRKEAETNPELEKTIDSGKLADPHIIYDLLLKAFDRYGKKRIILDNFPRNREQADWLIDHLDKKPPEKIDLLIIDIPDREVAQRLQKRGRDDDTPEAIEKRLNIFRHDVNQAIRLLHDVVVPVKIDGVGSVEQVHQRIMQALAQDEVR